MLPAAGAGAGAETWLRAWRAGGPAAGAVEVGGAAAVVVVLGSPAANDPGRALAVGLAGSGGGVPPLLVFASKASRSGAWEPPPGLSCWGADPGAAGGVRTVFSRLLGLRPLARVALLAPTLPALGTLRSVQLFHALVQELGGGTEVSLFLGAEGPLPERSHAQKKVVYAAGGHSFDAHSLWTTDGDPQETWQQQLLLCAIGGAGPGRRSGTEGRIWGLESSAIVAHGVSKGDGGVRRLVFPPVVLSVKDQMHAARDDIEREVFLHEQGHSGWVSLKAGCFGRLVRSSAERFTVGGYAEEHYIRSDPSQNGMYFELEVNLTSSTGEPPEIETAGFVAFSVYSPGKGVPTPYAPPGRLLACAQIDRLVVRQKWRGKGCFRALVEPPCRALCQQGYPVRIRTSNPVAKDVLEGCGLFKYEGRVLPGQVKCGVQKRRPRRIYVDLDPSGAAVPSSSGGAVQDDREELGQGTLDTSQTRRPEPVEERDPLETALRRLTSVLNRITIDSEEKFKEVLENQGREAIALSSDSKKNGVRLRNHLQTFADTIVGHAVRNHGPGTSALMARSSEALGRGVSTASEEESHGSFAGCLEEALSVSRSAACQVLRNTALDAELAPRFGGGAFSGDKNWAVGEASGRLEAAANLEARLCEVGMLTWDGGLERCRLVFKSNDGKRHAAELDAACSFLSIAGPQSGPLYKGAIQECIEAAAAALSPTAEIVLLPRSRLRLTALCATAMAGWPRATPGAAFSRGVADVRQEAARDLGVEMAPGRGQREGWVFWFTGRAVHDPASGALWTFRGARTPGGPFVRTGHACLSTESEPAQV